MSSKRFLPGATAATMLALAITGCGGAGSGSAGTSAATNTGQSAPADSFLSRVMAIVAGTSETAEPVEVGSVDATMPEDTEPAPVS